MSFAVPVRSKREPGRRAGGLARIFMKSMKEIKLNKPVRISNKELPNNPTSVSEALPHNVPKNLHVANEKTECVTVEKPPSTSHSVLASHEVHVDHRKHPTKRPETKISECDKESSSTQVGYNFNGQQGSSLPGGRSTTEQDVQGKDSNNNTVIRTSVHETATVVQSEKSALVKHVSNTSVVMDKEVHSLEAQNISNKRDVFKSSRFVASHGTTNRSREEKNSVFNKPLPRRYSQRRHSNNSRERVVKKEEPEDWSSDLLEVEVECFYDSSKTNGFSTRCTKDEDKINMGQNDKLVKDEKENVKYENQEGKQNSAAESNRDQRKCDTSSEDTEMNCPTNADKKTTEKKNKVNLEMELNADTPHENMQISKKSLETGVIVEKSFDNKRMVGKCLDIEQTCGNNFGNVSVSSQSLDISTQMLDTKQLEDETAAREDTVFNSKDKEQVVSEIRDSEIEQDLEKDLYPGCDAYNRKDRNIKTNCESRNIGVKTEEECETQTSEKLETAGSSLMGSEEDTVKQSENVVSRNEECSHVMEEQQCDMKDEQHEKLENTGSSLVRSEKDTVNVVSRNEECSHVMEEQQCDMADEQHDKLENTGSSLVKSKTSTVNQSENVVFGNEERSHVMEQQQCDMEDNPKCEPVNNGERDQGEIQDCRKNEYDQKQPLRYGGNLGDMNTNDCDGEKEDGMRIETPPLRVPVCEIPAYYNRRRNSGTFSDTSNASHSSSSRRIPSKDIGCRNSLESKTAPIPSLLGIKSSPWRDYSSASSDSSTAAKSSRPRQKKPKKKSKYTKSMARGHTLTVSPIQRSPSGSPTSHKNIRGRKSGSDTKYTYDSLINSKVQALSVEMKAKVFTPPDSSGRTMMAKPIMYRDSLRAMKQVRVKAGRKNISARQVRSEQSKLETSKMEPIIIAQVSSEPKRMDHSESKYTESRRRNYSESSKDENSDSRRHGNDRYMIIPQVSSEPATEEIGDNTCRHKIIPKVSSEPKFRDNSGSTGNTSLENTGEIKSDSRIQDSPDFKNHHHSESTADGRLRSGFQIHSEQTVNQEGKSESTRVDLNTQESTPILHIGNSAYESNKLSAEFKDQHPMEHGHKETSESIDHLNQEARNSETLHPEDLCNQESRNLEFQNLNASDSRNCDLKSCDKPKFGLKGTTNPIQQEKSFKGYNSSEHVRQENSSQGHSSSKSVRQDKSCQGHNISCEGHNSSEQRMHECSSQGHSTTDLRRQDKSFQGHTSSQPVRQNNSSEGHSISESIRNINSCKGHNRSQPLGQNYSSSHHNRLKPTQQDKSFSTRNRSESISQDNSSTTYNRSESKRQFNSSKSCSEPLRQDNSLSSHKKSELIRHNSSQDHNSSKLVRQNFSSTTHNRSELSRQDNSSSTHNRSDPTRQDNSSITHNRSDPTRQENSSTTDNRSELSRQDNSSTTHNRSDPTRQDNSSTTHNRSDPTRQDNSSTTHNRSDPTRQDNSSTTVNRSEQIRHDKLSQDYNRPGLAQKSNLSQSYCSSESRKYRTSESRDQNLSQHDKHCYADHSSYHRDSSGSRCFHNGLRSSRIVHSEPQGTNSDHWESVSCTALKRQNSSESRGNISSEKGQGWKKPVSSDPKQPGHSSMEHKCQKSQKILGEKLNVNLRYNREANDNKQVESSEYENWETDLLTVVTPPDSSIDHSDDGVKFTKQDVSATNVSMLTSESRTENASDKKLEKLEEKEKSTVTKFETSDGPAIRMKEHVMDDNSLSGHCGKDTHNESLQDKTNQQQQNKYSEAKHYITNQANQHNTRSSWPDYKTNSVTFRDVRNDGTHHREVNCHGTDADQRKTVCKTCGRSQLKSSSNTWHNCICQRTSSVPKGGHVTLNSDSSNAVWYPSSKQQCKSTCQQENYGCDMEQSEKSDYRKDMNRIEDNGTSGRSFSCSSKTEHYLNIDSKSSKTTANDKDQGKVLVVQPMHVSSNHTRSEWNRIDDQRKNYERKCPWYDTDRQRNPVLDEPEENWDSHLLDIEGILKTQGKTETMEQVVPGEQELMETSILSNNDPTGKPPGGGSRTRHQLEEWDSTLLDLNLIGTSALEQEENNIISEEKILPEKHINKEWCEVQTCVESVSKVKSGLSSDYVMSACLNNVEEEDGSIIPQSDGSFSGTQETSVFEDGCTSDDVMESYVFLSQEECCAQDVPLHSTPSTQTSTDLETEKLCHKLQTSPGTYRPPVFSQVDKTMYTRHSDVDFKVMENDRRHHPDLKQKKGKPPGYGPKECVCPPGCVQFWTWRCCFCHWGWEPRICDVRSALDYSDNFTSQSTEDKDSTEKGIRMRYSPRGLLAMRSNSVIPPPPSRELWNQMQQGIAPANSLSPRGTGPPSSPANMPPSRKPFPRMQYPGSYPYPPDYGSQSQQVMSYSMRHCSPYTYRPQFRPSSPPNDGAPLEQEMASGKFNYDRESMEHVSFVSRDGFRQNGGESRKPQNLRDSSTGLMSAKEAVSSDEMQDLQLNSPKLVDYGFSETDDSEEEKKDQLIKSRVALFGKDDQSQDSDCSSEKRKLDVEEQELNDDEDCCVGHKRRHVLPQSNIYHFIRHSLNTEENKKEDDNKATAYVPPHRRQKITLTDGPERDSQRAKENDRKTAKKASANDKHLDVSSPASKQSSSSPGSYPWTPFWASPPPQALGMSVSPLFGYHQPPCMYPPSCYFSPPNWYHAGSGTDSYGGAYPQPNHSSSTNTVKSPTTPHQTSESIPELSKLQADQKSPKRLVLPPRTQFLERTRLLGSNTDSESSSSFRLVDWKVNFKEKCKSYCGTFIDSHCHLDFLFNRQSFKGTWSKYKIVHEGTMPDCFEGCVAVFCHPGSFRQEGLWKEIALEEDVWLAFGCHPKNATEFSPRAEEGLIRCLQHKRVVALGEIGLDYSGIFKQHKTSQKIVFIKQIQLALEMNKPLVIHCREAEEDALQILEETVPRNYRIHCHCFTGNYESAKKWMNLFPNLYIGLTPLVTYRTATPTHEVARFIPLDRLLLETDAPYFIPRKFPKEDVHFSHPGMAITVAEHVAFLKRCSVTEVLHACRQNTRTMYGI